jgi:glycosyltransferase involved in cell wall biosynthesis
VSSARASRIRVLAVDHTAGVVPFRRKFAALAALPDIELTVLAPDRWVENYRAVRATARSNDGYRLDIGGVIWPGYENRAFFISGLAGAMRRARPDILHLWEEPFSFIALQALLLRRGLAPRAKALFFSSDNLARDFRYPYRPAAVYAAIERWVHRECEVGTAVSGEVVDVLRAKGYRGPIDVVPHGLDLEAYPEPNPVRRAAARARIGARGVVIGYAGRLLAMKGIDILLRAAAVMAARAGRDEFTVVLMGEGPDRERLRTLAGALGIGDRALFLPSVAHEAIPAALEAFDVTVVPSLSTPKWKEQFGRAALEGMAAGSAVVVSSSGALPYVVDDAGIVTPEGDAAALAEVLTRLVASPGERAALGARGRERARIHFTWSAIASSLAARYRAMLGVAPALGA